MKGLFLKEFYQWLKTRAVFTVIYVVLFAALIFTSEGRLRTIPASLFGVVFGLALNSFMLDEKSGWNEYSRVLPCSPFQRVTAKYIFFAPELMLVCFAEIACAIIPQKLSEDFYIQPGLYSEAIVYFAAWMICISITLPLCIFIKENKKYALACIPLLLTFVASTLAASKLRYSVLPEWLGEILTEKTWIYPVVILISVGILVVSWLTSVAIEAGKDKAYRNRYSIRAAVAGIATLAVFATSIFALYSSGCLPDPTFGEVSCATVEKIKAEANPYYDFMCGESNMGKTHEECVAVFKSIGYSNQSESNRVFLSDSEKIIVSLTVDKETNLIKHVSFSSKINTKLIKGGVDSDFEEIAENFTAGMTEKELHAKIKELELIPSTISEKLSKGKLQRNYYFKFATDNFTGASLSSDIRSVSVKVIDNVIDKVEITHYKDGLSSVLSDFDTVLAPEEMRIILDNFCSENHLEKTTEDNKNELEALGFMNLRSASGSINANVVHDEETGLTDYIYISGKVGEPIIENATKEELEALCDNFPDDMSEEDLILKFHELGVVPHEILESRNYEKKHKRNYEITYLLENYDGGDDKYYEINIDVIEGKVFDVRTYIEDSAD